MIHHVLEFLSAHKFETFEVVCIVLLSGFVLYSNHYRKDPLDEKTREKSDRR